MFVVSFAKLKSRALFRDTSGERAEMRFRAQASHGDTTILSLG